MLFVLTPSTVADAERLRTRQVPRRFLSLGLTVFPGGWPGRLFWRVLFEKSLLRYVIALAPFPLLILVRPEWALGLSQAPLLMFGLVLIIETYVLSIGNPDKRRRLVPEAESARGLDLLRLRGVEALSRIAAGRGIQTGELHLVVEQSGLMRVPVLTMASVQSAVPEPHFLDLDAGERRLIGETLFADDLDERRLQRISTATNTYCHVITLDPTTISAHARLQAMADARAAAPAA